MAKKQTYWGKHKDKLGEANRERPPVVEINDAQKNAFEEGRVLLIDKELHWTSFDVVRKIRSSIRIKKVGHAGTLDPLATGLLIVCTGKFTKKINEYMAQEKEYTGSFTLGAITPTYDLESEPQDIKDISGISAADIRSAVTGFMGEIQQFPPVYSAIKKDGVALYELARRGDEVELQARTVFIKEFEITSIEMPLVYFRVVCSTGTYIRSLANDFGKALGCGAYLSSLRRTSIGNFNVKDALTIDAFMALLKTGN
ncbi:MAG: tRNA pseudouridine(55) synthase TruB [Ferruginibacter sp.]